MNSRLTLNYGLRYDLPFPYTETHNRQNLFVPGAQSTVLPAAPAGLLYPGDPRVPAGLIATQKTANARYYGRPVRANDILTGRIAAPARASVLRAALDR